jgi:Zn-dependent peptidase ImmA (M78 family)
LHRSNAANFKSQCAHARKRWTLAHEIGHIYLEHTKDNAEEEREANLFASELLMPELVILELKRRLRDYGRTLTISEVERLFGVSQSAAANRMKQIESKEFFSPYLHKEFVQKYEFAIDNYAGVFEQCYKELGNVS